ncbi:hypothetical protein ACH3XW_25455 [Acanthocheilonema viteae]
MHRKNQNFMPSSNAKACFAYIHKQIDKYGHRFPMNFNKDNFRKRDRKQSRLKSDRILIRLLTKLRPEQLHFCCALNKQLY